MDDNQGLVEVEMHTFEAFSTCLFQEAFFLAVIRNVPSICLDFAQRVDLELSDLPHRILVEPLKRRVIYLTLDLTLGKDSSIFSHLRFLNRAGREC